MTEETDRECIERGQATGSKREADEERDTADYWYKRAMELQRVLNTIRAALDEITVWNKNPECFESTLRKVNDILTDHAKAQNAPRKGGADR